MDKFTTRRKVHQRKLESYKEHQTTIKRKCSFLLSISQPTNQPNSRNIELTSMDLSKES